MEDTSEQNEGIKKTNADIILESMLQKSFNQYEKKLKEGSNYDDLYLKLEKQKLLDNLYVFSKNMFSHKDAPANKTELSKLKTRKIEFLKNKGFVEHQHQKDLCKVLTALAHGYYSNLSINLPPSTGKSYFTMVTFPLWEAITNIAFREKEIYILISRDEKLRRRNMSEIANICLSEYFYHLFKDEGFTVIQVNSEFIMFENGIKMFTSNLVLTGHHPSVIIADDLLDLNEAYNKPKDTEAKVISYITGIPSRGEDKYRRIEIYGGHGVKPQDIVHNLRILSNLDTVPNGLDYFAHFWQAAYYEPDNHCKLYINKDDKVELFWEDNRTELNYPLVPTKVKKYSLQKKKLSSSKFAAQYQQRFDDDGQLLFKSNVDPIISANIVPKLHKILWGVDFAYTISKNADYTVFVQIGVSREAGKNPVYFILDIVRFQCDDPKQILDRLENAVTRDASIGWGSLNSLSFKNIVINIPFDPHTNLTIKTAKELFDVKFKLLTDKTIKSKEERASMFASYYNSGAVKIIDTCNNLDVLLDEIKVFDPNKNKNVNSIHDDCVDAAVQAFNSDVGVKKSFFKKIFSAKILKVDNRKVLL